MSHNNVGGIGLASELKELTTEPIEAVVRPKTARVELATCAWMVRWRTAVARLGQGRLGGGNNLSRVRRVLSRWRQSQRCEELTRATLGRWLAVGACQHGLIDPVDGSSKLEHGAARLAARWGRVGDWLLNGAEDGVN